MLQPSKTKLRKLKNITNWLIISQSTVYKNVGTTKNRIFPHPRLVLKDENPLVNKQTMDRITAKIKITPNITLNELITEFDLHISK